METPSSNNEQQSEKQQISRRLVEMAKRDQEARDSRDREIILKADRKNQEELLQIVDTHGWPSISTFGEEASNAAWMVAQHADENPAFQRQCFEHMKATGGDVSPENLAYLTDRVLVNEGRPQLFGTQWNVNEQNEFVPAPIEDEVNLDKRREEIGMPPFDEYAQTMQEQYETWKQSEQSDQGEASSE